MEREAVAMEREASAARQGSAERQASAERPKPVRGACPLDCPDTCSWIVTVQDGQAVSLRGDPHHPFTRGSLCNKVADYLAYTRSADRLLYPMRRTGPKGSGTFTRTTWDDAIATIAAKFRGIIAEYGAEAIWPYLGSGNMGLIQGVYGAGCRFWNVLGASRHNVTICTIAGGHGTGYTLGNNRVGMDPETFRYSRLILLWGANVLSTHPHFWRPILEARRNGAALVTIDPIRTRTAAASDCHLAPRPGTDAALALGLLNVVLGEGGEDRQYLETRTCGWDVFRRRVLEFPPDRAAAITGLPVASVIALGRQLARTRPTGIRIGIGLQRHGGGGMAVRTITCIPGVTGDWRYPGGGVFYDTRGFFGLNWQALWRDDLRPLDARQARTLSMTRLGEGLLELQNPPVKALFVYGSNPAVSIPHQTKVLKGLAREDLFTVVVEHFMTDTARYADILLPATMQTEHSDLLIAYGHLYLAWNEAAVAAPGECLSTTELFRRLARAMRLDEPALYESDETIARQILASGHASLEGITLERLRSRGSMRLTYPDPFVPFADAFPTPSGKVEFVSGRMADAGMDPVAGFTPPYEASRPDSLEYPLALITPANHYFLNSIFANVGRQRRRAGDAVVTIHPDDAAAVNVRSGDEVMVSNARGGFHAVAEVSAAVRKGVVASTKGRWPMHAKGGTTVNATVDERDSDMGGGAVYHDNRVRVERCG